MTIVVVGSANVDLVIKGPRLPRPGETVEANRFSEAPGGKGLNQAVAASRAGAKVNFFFAVGNDSGAVFLRDFLSREQLSITPVTAEEPTGRAFIQVDDSGQNSIMVIGGANTALDTWPNTILSEEISSAAFLVLQQEVSAGLNIELAKIARASGTTVVLTPAPAERTSPDLLDLADLVVFNETEAMLLGGHQDPLVAAEALSINRKVLLTQGKSGASMFQLGKLVMEVTAPEVEAVDTTGAGDCFVGNVVASLAGGASYGEATERGCQAAALSVTRPGSAPSMPTKEETDAFAGKD